MAVGVADVDLQVARFRSVDWTSGRGEMLGRTVWGRPVQAGILAMRQAGSRMRGAGSTNRSGGTHVVLASLACAHAWSLNHLPGRNSGINKISLCWIRILWRRIRFTTVSRLREGGEMVFDIKVVI